MTTSNNNDNNNSNNNNKNNNMDSREAKFNHFDELHDKSVSIEEGIEVK